jgi:hypothetical protein
MKKSLIFFCTWIILAGMKFSAFSQSKTTYRFGIKAGYNLARIWNKVPAPLRSNARFLPGYAFGLSLEQRFTPAVSMVYEALYTRQGSIFPMSTVTNERLIKEYKYLMVPALFRFHPRRLPTFLELGPQIGFLLDRNYRLLDDPLHGIFVPEVNLKSYDLNIVAGAGYRPNKHLLFEVRAFQSFATVFKRTYYVDPVTGQTLTAQPKQYNQSIAAFVQFTF